MVVVEAIEEPAFIPKPGQGQGKAKRYRCVLAAGSRATL